MDSTGKSGKQEHLPHPSGEGTQRLKNGSFQRGKLWYLAHISGLIGLVLLWKDPIRRRILHDTSVKDTTVEWPIPDNVTLDLCDGWKKTPGWFWQRSTAEASFELPLDLETLFLLSRGPHTRGIHLASSGGEGGTAKVTVTASYPHGLVLEDYLKVCTVDRAGREKGLGFFSPLDSSEQHPTILCDTKITIPTGGVHSPLKIPNFEANLVNSLLLMGLEPGRLVFDNIELRSVMAGNIFTTSDLQTKRIRISTNETVDGHIDARFSAPSELHLTDGSLHADLVLSTSSHPGEEKLANETIRASIKLRNTVQEQGTFSFEAVSSELFSLHFGQHQVEDLGVWHRFHSNSTVTVALSSSYEGVFDVSSSEPPRVQWEGIIDPTGQGRERAFAVKSPSAQRVTGKIAWGGFKTDSRRLKVDTNVAPVVLKL